MLFKNRIIAITGALLFGVNAMNVESVAWISERKNLLYALFFLSSLLSYLKYIDSQKKQYYLLSLLLFFLSCLSKGQAVVLSVVVIFIDYVRNRNLLNFKTISEKIPFLIISIVFGIIALYAQNKVAAIHWEFFTPETRIIFAHYGLTMYLFKLLIPIKLSAFYPYPAFENILTQYGIFCIVTPLIIYALYYFRKNKIVIFSIIFFLSNIVLVLQLIMVGGAVMADRYVYMPCIGYFIILGLIIDNLLKKNSFRFIIYPLSAVYVIFLSFLTFNQTKVWNNSESLWNSVIKNYPRAHVAWYNLGIGLEKKNETALAEQYYTNAINASSNYYEAYYNRGLIRGKNGRFEEAIEDFNSALRIVPNYIPAYTNRAIANCFLKRFDKAIEDFNNAVNINPKDGNCLYNRGILKINELKDKDGGCSDLKRAAETGFEGAEAAFKNNCQ